MLNTLRLSVVALLMLLASAAAQTVSTDFEGLNSNDFTLGTAPGTARFTSGLSISVGIPELYHSGDYSWMVFDGGTMGIIDFDAPAASVSCWLRDSDTTVQGLITVYGPNDVVLDSRNLTTDFVLHSFTGLGPIERIILRNVSGDGGSAAVLDDFTFTSLGCFPGTDAANCPDDGLYCNGSERCDAQLGCVSSGSPCPGTFVCDEAANACNECAADAVCNDGIGCTDDRCVSGTCVFTAVHARCAGDGLFCNGVERCDTHLGCISPGNPCTAGDVCNDATDKCAQCATDADCDDGLACTVDTCTGGACAFSADDAICPDNGQFCDGAEFCDETSGCASGGNPCPANEFCNETADTCDECNADGACDDDDACTDDACTGGACAHAPIEGCTTAPDGDGDGIADDDDACAGTATGAAVDASGCSCAQRDEDGDGVTDCEDTCPSTPVGAAADASGCACRQLDDDADGADNCVDTCPGSAAGAVVNAAGCAASQLDDDADGVTNELDACAQTPGGQSTDSDGCSSAQRADDSPPAAPARRACGLFGMINAFLLAAGFCALRTRKTQSRPERLRSSH